MMQQAEEAPFSFPWVCTTSFLADIRIPAFLPAVLTDPRYNPNVVVICIFLMGEYVPFLDSHCPVILLLKSVYSIDFPADVIVCFSHVNFFK